MTKPPRRCGRVREVVKKIVALHATDLALMRLKARAYLWSESTDFEAYAAENEGSEWSEGVLVSLFGDLDADRAPDPVLARLAKVRAIWDQIGEILNANEEDEAAIKD